MKPSVTIAPMMVTVVTIGVHSYGVGVGALTCMHVARAVMRVEQIMYGLYAHTTPRQAPTEGAPCLALVLFR